MKSRSVLLLLIVINSALIAAAAESPPSLEKYLSGQFPDNSDLRAKLFSAVIGAPRELAEAYGERVLQSRAAGTVTVRTVPGTNSFFVEFLNGTGGVPTQGSCIIKRSNAKGYLVQAKIYLQDDPSCYARLYTGGEGTRLDIIMYGAVVKRGLRLPELLYTVLAGPFSNIVNATRGSFDWSTVFGLGSRDGSTQFAASLRGALASAPPATTWPAGAPPPSSGKADSGKPPAKLALAAARPPSGLGAGAGLAVDRPYRIAMAVDRADSADHLLAALAATGEAPQELAPASVPDLAYDGSSDDLDVSLPYGNLPSYAPGRGVPLSALRAILYLDALSSPDAVYAAVGEGLRLTVAPLYDDSGRLRFAFFSGGREMAWSDFAHLRSDLPVRIIRLRASQG